LFVLYGENSMSRMNFKENEIQISTFVISTVFDLRIEPRERRLSPTSCEHSSSNAIPSVGMPEPDGTDLIKSLLAHATQERFLYTHRWQPGDLLIWDNRCTMHRVLPFDQQRYRRRVHRTTLSS
jgi:hypothetical protein